jgi:hypothetical protein
MRQHVQLNNLLRGKYITEKKEELFSTYIQFIEASFVAMRFYLLKVNIKTFYCA